MVNVELTVSKFKALEERGSIIDSISRDGAEFVYYYNPEIANHLFRREHKKWDFVALTVDEIEDTQVREDVGRLIKKWGNEPEMSISKD